MADHFASQGYSLTKQKKQEQQKKNIGDRKIKQLLNSVIGKYRDLSVYRRSIICLSLRLATEKSGYFAQSRLIIVNNFL